MSVIERIIEREVNCFEAPIRVRASLQGKAPPDLEKQLQEELSSTVIFTFKIKGGKKALIGGDRRTSNGFMEIYNDDMVKVHRVGAYSMIAFTGFVSAAQMILKDFRAVCGAFEENFEILSPDGQANYLSRLVSSYYLYYVAYAIPILTTFDVDKKEVRIFHFGPTGACMERKDYEGAGCGWDKIHGLLDKDWEKDIDEEKALDLAAECFLASGLLSSGVSDSRESPPLIFIVGPKGIEPIDEKKIRIAITNADIKRRRNRGEV